MTFDFPLKFSSSHYGDLINKIFRHIHPVNYSKWQNIRMMSLLEFACLSTGFEPAHTGSLDSFINELNEALHNLDSNELRSNALRLDDDIVNKFAKFNRAYAGRDGLDVYEKILSNANHLLSYAEVISREAILISEDERKLYSIPKSNIEMWRTGFLICWAIGLPNLKIPNEIIAFDKGFDKENEALIKQLVTLDQNTLLHEGWFNTNACRAPKLSALIDGYVQEEKLVASKNNRNFSTGNIAKYIKKNFEIVNPNDSDEENFVKKLSEVATIEPKGISLKKKSPK